MSSGEATVLSSGAFRVMDGTVRVTHLDRASVDHVYQMHFRQAVRAKKARTTDTTEPIPQVLKEHLVNAK